jgi:hypothetical protein
MVFASGVFLLMLTITPFYCNPFFRRCKQFFCHFASFFEREQEKIPYFSQQTPKIRKKRAKQPPQSDFPQSRPCAHGDQIGDADVGAAEPEGQK